MRTFVQSEPDVRIPSAEHLTPMIDSALTQVVDPMIYRVAEVYLEGSTERGSAQEDLEAGVRDNLAELIAFFDLLVFSDRLPMIDYGLTFHDSMGFASTGLYELCNTGSYPQVMYAVHIEDTASLRAKAIDAVVQHRPTPSSALSKRVAQELKVFDHQWRPDLSEIDDSYCDPDFDSDQRAVDTFVYGGVLFGLLAQGLDGAHVLQGKRARLQLEVGFEHERPTNEDEFDDEDRLFKRLDELFGAELEQAKVVTAADAVALPPVLPYL